MRLAILTAVLLAFTCSSLFAVSAGNWNKMVFTDGKARSIADFEGQTTAVFAFCRGWAGFPSKTLDTIRQLVDRRNKEYLPISIILVTSNSDVPALKATMKTREVEDDGLNGVYYAGTPLHGSKVYDLGGVIYPTGKHNSLFTSASNLVNQNASSFGEMALSKEGIVDPMALKAWWYLANGEYSAYQQVKKLTKKKGPPGEQANLLLERVDTLLSNKAETLLKTEIVDINSYEKAERLYEALNDAKIKSLKDATKELKSALKDAAKSDLLKEELKARGAYEMLMALAVSNKAKEKQQAKDGLRHLATALPDTHYGKLADLRASSLAGL